MTKEFKNSLLKHLIENNLKKLEAQEEIEGERYFRCFKQITHYNGPRFNEYMNRFLQIKQRYFNEK